MSIVLGLNAKLFRGEAGQTADTEVVNVKDVSLSLESGEADITTRKTKGWRAYAATLKEASVEFEINYDTDDADFGAFQNAYLNNKPIALFITDGAGNGLDADFVISNFSWDQPLEDALKVSVTAKPTCDKRSPAFVVASATPAAE